MRVLVILCTFLAVSLQLVAQESPPSDAAPVDTGDFVAELESHSGAPLLLKVSIPDPRGVISSVSVEGPTSRAYYSISSDPDRTAVELTISPFLSAGVYDLVVRTEAEIDGDKVEFLTPAQVGFVDYVYGRDNLRFGNNADFESVIGTYGEILEAWLDERFGGISDAQLVPLVDYMYHFFGKRSGRCYAFAGSEARFWKWPELLPTYYDETYDLYGTVSRTQREMNFLQLDMVFDHFLTGGYDLLGAIAEDPAHGTRDVILDQVWRAVSQIAAGEPVVVGLIGPELHHAMLVYGFIHRPEAATVDLLVSNNWKSDQNLNMRSTNAESIRVSLEPQEDGHIFEWRYVDGVRDREISRLFTVDVQQQYAHDPDLLDAVISARTSRLVDRRRAVLVVEEAVGAWITDGQESTGYRQRRTVEELDDVVFDKVNRTYRFEYPADQELWLELDDDAGARVLFYRPGQDEDPPVAWTGETEEPEDGATIRRRLSLGSDGMLPAVLADAGE